MGFFRREEDLSAEERRKKTLERFKAALDSMKSNNNLFRALEAVDTLNQDIDEATKEEIKSSLGGRIALGAAEKLESTQRTLAGAGSDIARETLSLTNLLADKTGIYDVDDELLERQEEFVKVGLESLVGEESVEMKDRGDGRQVAAIKEPEYAGGEVVRDMTAILGSVFAGTKGVDKIGKLVARTNSGKKLVDVVNSTKATRAIKNFGKATVGGEVGIQFSQNPFEDRFANMLGELIGEDKEALHSIIEYLEADENKSELENRAGLFVEGLAFAGALASLPAVYFGGKAVKETFKNKDTIMKALQDVKLQYREGSLDIQGFKEIMNEASNKITADKTPPVLVSKGDELEDVSKLWQFSSNKLKRAASKLGLGMSVDSIPFLRRLAPGIGIQEFFRSRGYFTPKTYELFNQGQAAKNAWAARAEDLAENLEKQIEQLSNKYKKYNDIDALKTKVNNALENTDEIKNLPKALREDVTLMRNTMDAFSEQLLELPNSVVSKELKETIRKNMGSWLHRSYDVFESSALASKRIKDFKKFKEAYKKGDEEALAKLENSKVFGPAVEDIKNIFRGQKQYKGVDDISLTINALDEVDKILVDALGTNTDSYLSRMDNFFGSGKSMLSRRSDLLDEHEALRNLLGEVKSPSVNFLKSTIQINNFVQDYRFTEEAFNLLKGRRKRTFKSLDEPQRLKGHVFSGRNGFVDSKTGIRYMTQLKGKQYGALNGKWMTEEMAAMFGERAGLIGGLDQMNWYKSFLAAKGYGQASKTVFNHITHLRNTIGGAFFTLANGQNPFSEKGKNAAKAIYNKRFANVKEKEAVEYYNKLIELDLVNTSARYGDIQQLFKDSADSGMTRWLNDTTNVFGSTKETLKKYGKNIQDLYIAEDDFFKIVNFEQELDTLVKASKNSKFKVGNETLSFDEYVKRNPNYMDTLEKEAANIVRNTIPTYSLVPTGIKQLRKLPFGNYFSFPAEMVRTSYNIVNQGLNELFLSGNRTIQARGARRLGGFLGVGMFGNEGLSELTKKFHGVTNEEEERLRHLNPYDYAKNSKFIFYRDKNGDLYQNDFSFIDPYDTIKRPLQTAIINFAHGEKTKENLDKVMMESLGEGMKEFFEPFYSEAMFTKAIMDITRGQTTEGYPIEGWREGDIGDKVKLGLYELYRPFVPGAFQQVPKTVKAFMGDEYEELADGKFAQYLENITAGSVGNKEYSRAGQVIANLTGFRFEKVEPEKLLERKVKQYLRDLDDAQRILRSGTKRLKNVDDATTAIMEANAKHYYAFKELKLAVDAARYLDVDSRKAQLILKEAGLNKATSNSLNFNRYKPLLSSEQELQNFISENVKGQENINVFRYQISRLNRAYNGLPMINISFVDEIDNIEDIDARTVSRENIEFLRNPPGIEEAKERLPKVTGGIIKTDDNIPRVKENPANSINSLTGNPYIEEQMKELGLE